MIDHIQIASISGVNMKHTLANYGPVITELLSESRLAPLGPGTPNGSARALLAALTNETVTAPHPLRDANMAAACCAALWLYHDFLDESHQISQSIETAEGSYWHGLMHRRESDYSNAAYWFRRVGKHPVFQELAEEARRLAAAESMKVTVPSPWDPFWFIDYCQACEQGREPGAQFARLVQQREWELLFSYCYQRALGEGAV
jgi:hypothetical protein